MLCRGVRQTKFDHLPGPGKCVYVAELSDGLIKVGYTDAPRERAIRLNGDHWRHSRTAVTRFEAIASDAHKEVERELIAALRKLATAAPSRREYFSGLPFEAALELSREVVERVHTGRTRTPARSHLDAMATSRGTAGPQIQRAMARPAPAFRELT